MFRPKFYNTQEFAEIVGWISKIREQEIKLEIDSKNAKDDDNYSTAKLKVKVFQKLLKELDDTVDQYNQQQQNSDTQIAEQEKREFVSKLLSCANRTYQDEYPNLAIQRSTVNHQVKATAATAAYVAPFIAGVMIPATWMGVAVSTYFFAPIGPRLAYDVMRLPEPTTYSLKLIAGLIHALSKVQTEPRPMRASPG